MKQYFLTVAQRKQIEELMVKKRAAWVRYAEQGHADKRPRTFGSAAFQGMERRHHEMSRIATELRCMEEMLAGTREFLKYRDETF